MFDRLSLDECLTVGEVNGADHEDGSTPYRQTVGS